MNKLCKYKGILTILIPHNLNYYTYPVDDYDIDIPVVISAQDPNIELISIAKLHFSEARNIIRLLIEDVHLDDVAQPVLSIQAPKPALSLHAVFNKEY